MDADEAANRFVARVAGARARPPGRLRLRFGRRRSAKASDEARGQAGSSTGRPSAGCRNGRSTCRPTARELDPPLREDWSINTHGLIEFPPAVADGVAYVVNKFGNLHAVRLDDHTVLWERERDPKNRGKPTDVTAPGLLQRTALHRLHRRRTGRPQREDGGDRMEAQSQRPSRILADGHRRDPLHRHRHQRARR